MQISKLTQKCKVTVPEGIRCFLGLKPGDRIAFTVENSVVTIRKVSTIDVEFAESLAGTLGEWSSTFDEEAYRNL